MRHRYDRRMVALIVETRCDSSHDEYQINFDHGTKLNRIDVLGRNIASAVTGLGTMLW